MNLSAKVEYACLAMMELGRVHQDGRLIQIKRLAAAHGIPPKFLVQILLQLKSAGLVHSTRGATGGYALAIPPDEVSLGDVIRAVEGRADQQTACQSPLAKTLHDAWNEIHTHQWHQLDTTTLADLIVRVPQNAQPMYYI